MDFYTAVFEWCAISGCRHVDVDIISGPVALGSIVSHDWCLFMSCYWLNGLKQFTSLNNICRVTLTATQDISVFVFLFWYHCRM